MVVLSSSLPFRLLSLQRYLSTMTIYGGPPVAAIACRVDIRLGLEGSLGLLWSASSAHFPPWVHQATGFQFLPSSPCQALCSHGLLLLFGVVSPLSCP